MKWVMPFVIVAVLLTDTVQGQIKQGTWEFSMSGNFGSSSGSTEQSGAISFKTDQPAEGYLSLAFRPGFYVIEGLVVEPELLWTALEGAPPSLSLMANAAYHFEVPQSRMVPFVLAGYGWANGIPRLQVLQHSTDGFDVTAWNIGAGIKYFLSLRVAVRAEYRFQRYSYETTSSLGAGLGNLTNTISTRRVFHNFFFGFSIFL